MTKTLLLLLALQGLGDDSFQVRQASERYLAASGYVVVPLNRVAPACLTNVQSRATLRKLERRYYASYAWGARAGGPVRSWREYPSLVLLSPWPHRLTGTKDVVLHEADPFHPLTDYYGIRAARRWGRRSFHGFEVFSAATCELFQDLRSWAAPGWAGAALWHYLHWRERTVFRG
jgi:hypothetical protein